jgi:tRNA/tmRNA/rRNA uracil-C5-methylase (TrmA/RlmC/RlmD family)
MHLGIITPLDGHIEAFCPLFGMCGSHQDQDITYPLQFDMKRACVGEVMLPLGHICADFSG